MNYCGCSGLSTWADNCTVTHNANSSLWNCVSANFTMLIHVSFVTDRLCNGSNTIWKEHDLKMEIQWDGLALRLEWNHVTSSNTWSTGFLFKIACLIYKANMTFVPDILSAIFGMETRIYPDQSFTLEILICPDLKQRKHCGLNGSRVQRNPFPWITTKTSFPKGQWSQDAKSGCCKMLPKHIWNITLKWI